MIAQLEKSIQDATEALFRCRQGDGHWVFELEADATIPAEYVLLKHYLGEEPNKALEAKIATYLRRIQGSHGGWPLFHGGDLDVSASAKAYFALKMIGDRIEDQHMVRAREAIRARGGAERSNVFTRVLLALFGIMTWSAVPAMPVEIMLLPRWFPFHLSKISYWARTVIAPLLVLRALRPLACNPRHISIDELFIKAPHQAGALPKSPHQKWSWFVFFRAVDAVVRRIESLFSSRIRQRAIDEAVDFVTKRLNGEDGFGAIFPAMANTVMMFDVLGYPADHPHVAMARAAIEKLLIIKPQEAYCQPCVSPVWDTSLVCHTLIEVGSNKAIEQAVEGLKWLEARQVLDIAGDWAVQRPCVRPGGWAFQYANPHYPDLDDTAVVVMAMDRARNLNGSDDFSISIERAREWIIGLQSRNGGWAAFDVDNIYEYLNNIPFSDHGALLDPPTSDLTARCVSMLAQLGDRHDVKPVLISAIEFLRREQRHDGSWYGRWGMNYIYGTWSVLCALNAMGMNAGSPEIRRAANWLVAIQNLDGGWGEDGTSYRLDYGGHEPAPSTASQTAWALLGLMAAGEIGHPSVERGVSYLVATQNADGFWDEEQFTSTGFPRVFYLRYHGYPKFFPLWALARYRNLRTRNIHKVKLGM